MTRDFWRISAAAGSVFSLSCWLLKGVSSAVADASCCVHFFGGEGGGRVKLS